MEPKPVDDKEMAIIEEIPSLHNGIVSLKVAFYQGRNGSGLLKSRRIGIRHEREYAHPHLADHVVANKGTPPLSSPFMVPSSDITT